MSTTFRDRPCGCGSGQIYRRCCGSNGPFPLKLDDPKHVAYIRGMKPIRSWQLIHGSRPSLEMLLERLRKLDLRHVLLQIGHANRGLETSESRYKGHVSREGLALLSKYALLHAADKDGAIPTSANMDDMILMCNDIMSREIDGTPEERAEQFARFFIQQAQANDIDRSYGHALPRTILLFDDLARGRASRFDIPASFSSLTGMTVREFMGASFASWILLRESMYLRLASFKTAEAPNAMQLAEQYLGLVSVSVDQVREEFAGSDHEPHTLNPLFLYPLIRFGSGADAEYVCPILSIVLEKATNGLYHMMWTKYKEPFSQTMGYVFQDYVGDVLRPYAVGRQVLPEAAYGGGRLSTDWSIVEGRNAALLECKLKRLRAATKMTGARALLEEDLKQGVVKGLVEMNRVVKDIQSRKYVELSAFQRVRNYWPIAVFLDEMYLANEPFMRRLIRTLLPADIAFNDRRYRIISAEELENLLPLAEALDIPVTRVIENWSISEEFEFDSLRNYKAYAHAGEDIRHKGLGEKYAEISEQLTRLFFPSGPAKTAQI